MAQPLAGLRATLLGAEGPLGRDIAVTLTEAGAVVTVIALSENRRADFAVHSIENELWALGRSGGAAVIDARDAEAVTAALDRAGAVEALVTHLVWDGAPDVAGALLAAETWPTPAKAAVHVLGPVAAPADADLRRTAALLAAVRRSAGGTGARINAVVADARLLAQPEPPPLHVPPRPLALPAAVVYLLSDEGASLRGTVIVAT